MNTRRSFLRSLVLSPVAAPAVLASLAKPAALAPLPQLAVPDLAWVNMTAFPLPPPFMGGPGCDLFLDGKPLSSWRP